MKKIAELQTFTNSWATGRKFQLHLFYQIDKGANNTPKLTLSLRYYCWDLYLRSFPIQVIINGTTYNERTITISDSNIKTRHYGELWRKTLDLPKNEINNDNDNYCSISFPQQKIGNYNLHYSKVWYTQFKSNGEINLAVPIYSQPCATPGAPTSNSYTSTKNQSLTISWNAVTGASKYALQYRVTENGTWRNLGTYTNNSVSDVYLKNLIGYALNVKYYFRVQAIGDGTNYTNSSFSSSSSAITTVNTPAEMLSLSVDKKYIQNQESSITLNYMAEDADGDEITYQIFRKSLEESYGEPIGTTSNSYYKDETISSLDSGTYTYKVQIKDTESFKEITIYKNNLPTITIEEDRENSFVNQLAYFLTFTPGLAAKEKGGMGKYKVSLFILEEKKVTDEYEIDVSKEQEIYFSFNYNDLTNKYTQYLLNQKEHPLLGTFYFQVEFYDSLGDYSIENIESRELPTWPDYPTIFQMNPLDGEGNNIHTVTERDNDVIKFNYSKEDGTVIERIRTENIIGKINDIGFWWDLSSISEANIYEMEYLEIWRSVSLEPEKTSYSQLARFQLYTKQDSVTQKWNEEGTVYLQYVNNPYSFNNYFIDKNVPFDPQVQYYVQYYLIFYNHHFGTMTTNPQKTPIFLTNTAPLFPDIEIKLSNSGKLNITPETNSSNPQGFTSVFSSPRSSYATNGSTEDEQVIINENNTVDFICGKYKAFLVFPENIIKTESPSVMTNEYEIATFYAADLVKNFAITELEITKDFSFIDGKGDSTHIGFDNISAANKTRIFPNVELRIYGYDTFEEKSFNYASKMISIDFTDSPKFVQKDGLEYFSIEDQTNNGENVIPLTSRESPRLMNPKELLNFSFLPAISQRWINAGKEDSENFPGTGISEYQILYSIKPTNAGNDYEPDWSILKTLTVGNQSKDYDLIDQEAGSEYTQYEYLHTIRDYSINSNIEFALIAIDKGQKSGTQKKQSNYLKITTYSNPPRGEADIMVCRMNTPLIAINNIEFEGDTPKIDNLLKLTWEIKDIGGSYITSNNDYFNYKNFERSILTSTGAIPGKFIKLDLLLSEDPNSFDWTSPNLIQLINKNSLTAEDSYFEKSIENFPIVNSEDLTKDGRYNYYAQIRLILGTNLKSSLENLDTCLVAYSPIVFLRSLRPTMSIRDQKIGINTNKPEHTFQVSASSDTDCYVQFDSGIEGRQVIKFDLNTGYMIQGIIDCGRIL